MNLHKMIEICLKDDKMHRFVMINALICINIYVITCMNSILSWLHLIRRREVLTSVHDGISKCVREH